MIFKTAGSQEPAVFLCKKWKAILPECFSIGQIMYFYQQGKWPLYQLNKPNRFANLTLIISMTAAI